MLVRIPPTYFGTFRAIFKKNSTKQNKFGKPSFTLLFSLKISVVGYNLTLQYLWLNVHTGEGKAAPLQASSVPEGSRKLRFQIS